ncbi:hypothetical protein NM208_g12209 [Fusarium decemcellulare]|uniref:Uncharacterized protein n=1 Tax=Fusarium decemcellulare TaxID=57161 RepID=A0ACC1RPX1_9HYPO|nr:hypothetical protein NM208_g12209 [Fusarium decemcellulare]
MNEFLQTNASSLFATDNYRVPQFSMSTTTTTSTRTLSTVLADYEIHLSPGPVEPPNAQTTTGLSGLSNPPGWPTDHRRVPPHRPVNYGLDPLERMVYNNRFEQGFINTMFFGLRIITVAHRTWKHTVGRWRDDVFRYELGGEH